MDIVAAREYLENLHLHRVVVLGVEQALNGKCQTTIYINFKAEGITDGRIYLTLENRK